MSFKLIFVHLTDIILFFSLKIKRLEKLFSRFLNCNVKLFLISALANEKKIAMIPCSLYTLSVEPFVSNLLGQEL